MNTYEITRHMVPRYKAEFEPTKSVKWFSKRDRAFMWLAWKTYMEQYRVEEYYGQNQDCRYAYRGFDYRSLSDDEQDNVRKEVSKIYDRIKSEAR